MKNSHKYKIILLFDYLRSMGDLIAIPTGYKEVFVDIVNKIH